MSELVSDNLTEAQGKQKRWYDRTARERVFKAGDQVLVLLPTSTSKLMANPRPIPSGTPSWEGHLSHRYARLQEEKANPACQYASPVAHAGSGWLCYRAGFGGEADDLLQYFTSGTDARSPTLGEQLDGRQRADLGAMFTEFQDVLQGRTSLAVHRIYTDTVRPVKLPPSRLAHAYRDTVKKELQEMLDAGIIEPSRSEWASPIVVVPKKDGGIRLCVDYRRLNSVTSGDAYPMPRIDELVDRLGGAKYLTTLDLSHGYWQVPVAEEDQAKTAFATHTGLYQFRVTVKFLIIRTLINYFNFCCTN